MSSLVKYSVGHLVFNGCFFHLFTAIVFGCVLSSWPICKASTYQWRSAGTAGPADAFVLFVWTWPTLTSSPGRGHEGRPVMTGPRCFLEPMMMVPWSRP